MGMEIVIDEEKARVRPVHSEVDRLWAENRKAFELFGWKPAYGGREGFRHGLTKTVAWFMQPENLARYKSNFYNI